MNRKQRRKGLKLGATNEFPRGKFNQADEGGLRFAIGVMERTVIVDFGTPVAWMGLDADTAEAFARSLIEKAAEARKQ